MTSITTRGSLPAARSSKSGRSAKWPWLATARSAFTAWLAATKLERSLKSDNKPTRDTEGAAASFTAGITRGLNR